MAEHKLTSEGLVNPDNAKKLGEFAGVDALVIGNIIPKNSDIQLTVKIITTDTAEIVGATKAQFKSDDTAKQFLSQSAPQAAADAGASGPQDGPAVVKSFGDLQVQLQSLHVVSSTSIISQQKGFLLTMLFTNQNPTKSIWVAISSELSSAIRASITDPNGNEFRSNWNLISGIANDAYQHGGFFNVTEIKPHDSTSATMKFFSQGGVDAAPGACRLQLEFLLGHQYSNGFGNADVQNFVTKVQAN